MYKFFVYFRGAAMKIKITSGENYAVLGLDGAMLNSLNKNNTEYLWQGDAKYWAGQAPVCFPITGVLPNGAAPKDVQELLGHADVSTTMNIYAHATREAKRTSARLLDKVIGGE